MYCPKKLKASNWQFVNEQDLTIQFQTIWIFKACSQLALKNDSKELQPFWTFFHNDLTLRSGATRIFVGTKKGILSLQSLITCNLHGGNFWIFFLHLNKLAYYNIIQLHVSKKVFFQKFGSCTRNGSFWVFWVIT